MGQTYTALDDQLRQFIEAQHVFFVATAPSSGDGHVNVSPKGLNTLRILGPNTVAYLDCIGSGVKGESELRTYQRAKNARSIDGLKGLRWVNG